MEVIVKHILWLRSMDVEYARQAFTWYCNELPWMDIRGALKEAMK